MGKTIRHGEQIEVAPCRVDELKPGAIVLFEQEGCPIVHRIIQTKRAGEKEVFVLRGDTLRGGTEEASATSMLGQVVAVYRQDCWKSLWPSRGWSIYGRGSSALGRLVNKALITIHPSAGRKGAPSKASELTYSLIAGDEKKASFLISSQNWAEDDWRRWLLAVEKEGLAALIGHLCLASKEVAGYLPEPVRSRLVETHMATLAFNLCCLRQIASTLRQLQDSGIQALVLKGAHLAEAVYPSVGCRPLGDVDILIRPHDVPRASMVLQELGYTNPNVLKGPILPSTTLNAVWWSPPDEGQIPIHLHWHLPNTSLPYGLATSFDIDRLWSQARTFETAGSKALGLAPHHLLIHLADHALVHRFDRLILLADIRALLEKEGQDLDWGELLSEAGSFRLASSLAMALLLAARYVGAPVPEDVLDQLDQIQLSPAERRFLGDFERYRGSLLWGWLIYGSRLPHWRGKAKYLWLSLRPEASRLALQPGGSVGLAGYAVFCIRRLAKNIFPRRGSW
jgi:hypothetical protein